MSRTELLAPAGDREAALAAFHYGADAVYLGLQRFSARAEAANFTPDELSEIVAYAHALQPRRSVFLAINTLVLNRELPEVVRTLGIAADLGVDALIIQDLGIARLARRYAPGVHLHASTQMAIHNVEGSRALKRLGFNRVTLARELTLDEVREVARDSGLEVEVFVHGALCYCYSGLCLYSSLLRGRSGNRGRCAYPCRERFEAATVGEAGFPFSMKDLALPDAVPELRGVGVLSFKIEGRKKSPLYVAAATHYYRRLLDGGLSRPAREAAEAEIQTIFARPWTRLYVQSARNRDVIDPEVVGHRGTPIGKADTVVRRGGQDWLRFTPRRRLEKHDGLQVDGGENGRPYGFAIEDLRPVDGKTAARPVFEVESGTRIEVLLPVDHPPVESGTIVYCSSSQQVKQRYRFDRPRPGVFRVRTPVSVTVTVAADRVRAAASVTPGAGLAAVTVEAVETGVFEVGRRDDAGEPAVRESFDKMGDTAFEVRELAVTNPERRFVPMSVLNRLRRALASALAEAVERARSARDEAVAREECVPHGGTVQPLPLIPDGEPSRAPAVRWSLKTDRLEHLDDFVEADWSGLDGLVVDVSAFPPASPEAAWATLTERLGAGRVRLALPVLMRARERVALVDVISRLWQAGCRRWEASNLWALEVLEQAAGGSPCDRGHLQPGASLNVGRTSPSACTGMKTGKAGEDTSPTCPPSEGHVPSRATTAGGTDYSANSWDLTADWPLYVLNRQAARSVFDLGMHSFVCSPEDGLPNLRGLLAEWGERAIVTVYQDVPLFISDNCGRAGLARECRADGACRRADLPLTSASGDDVRLIQRGCRTIVIGEKPFSLGRRLGDLRASGANRFRVSLVWRHYQAAEAVAVWRELRAGRPVAGREGNFERGPE